MISDKKAQNSRHVDAESLTSFAEEACRFCLKAITWATAKNKKKLML